MDDDLANKRFFPRMAAECPVLYSIGTAAKWQVGILVDMSATGLRMKTKEQLLRNIKINIMLKPGKNKLVPEITGKGKVVRCEATDSEHFEISCSLHEVKQVK
jgi:hypothetical protein